MSNDTCPMTDVASKICMLAEAVPTAETTAVVSTDTNDGAGWGRTRNEPGSNLSIRGSMAGIAGGRRVGSVGRDLTGRSGEI